MPTHLTRRDCLSAALSLAAGVAYPAVAQMQNYPSRPVRIIVPAAPGSASESIARSIAELLTRRTGQTFFVEAIGGAAGAIGTAKAMQAAPDGYTLLYGFNQLVTMNPHLYEKLPYDPQAGMSPISMVTRGSFLLLANNDLPVSSVQELIGLARSQPGRLSYASTGNGSAPHLGMELLKRMTGITVVHVPYKSGATAITDLIGGQVQLKIEPMGSAIALARGKVKALAVTGPQREPSLAELPAVAETVPGYELTGWNAMWAPTGTPASVINFLNGEMNSVLADAELRARVAPLGVSDLGGSSPAAVTELTRKESAFWGDLIRRTGIRGD